MSMIDIHSHILPNLDDGARAFGRIPEMARIAVEDGITHMVATPHMFNGLSHNPEPVEVAARAPRIFSRGSVIPSHFCRRTKSISLTTLSKKQLQPR